MKYILVLWIDFFIRLGKVRDLSRQINCLNNDIVQGLVLFRTFRDTINIILRTDDMFSSIPERLAPKN